MSQAALAPARSPARAQSQARRFSWNWIGLLPFFIFAIAFLILPSWSLFTGSFVDTKGNFTLNNLISLVTSPGIRDSYWLSIEVSGLTAIFGGLFGFLLAYSVTVGGLPGWVRSALTTFSGVASNFAGVPLAFAFIATLGRTGFATALLKGLGFNPYEYGFNLYSLVGLSLTYLYFQFPLMVLIMAPPLDGLKREWREASENLGATSTQYWRYVGLPILFPSLLGTMILLFGNAFGAYATAYALTGGNLNLITIQIGAQMTGDVLHNPPLGYAMAFGMVVIMALSIALYTLLQRQSERWLR